MPRTGSVLRFYPTCRLSSEAAAGSGVPGARRHASPGLEVRGRLLLRAVTTARVSACLCQYLGPVPQGDMKRADGHADL